MTEQTFNPPYGDIFGQKLDDSEKKELLTATWNNVHQYKFPSRYAQGRYRSLQAKYFSTYQWLRYSVKDDGLYCAPCHVFSGPDPQTDGLEQCRKVVGNHDKSEGHLSQCEAADNFIAVMSGQKKDIERCLSSQYNSVFEKNRQILVSIVEAIIFCGKQNIALRGHENEKGNFTALLKFKAKHDS
ncbi:hypothetical protein MAR_019033, partial [Mya arenaria]